jgi:hypothetical protein
VEIISCQFQVRLFCVRQVNFCANSQIFKQKLGQYGGK